MANGSSATKRDPNDPNANLGVFAKGIEYLSATLSELRRGNRWNNAMYDRARAGSLRNSSGRIQVDPHGQTDALGNALPGSADVILLQYPEDWDSCCEGDPPTGESLMLNVDYDVQDSDPPLVTDSIETAFLSVSWGGYSHYRELDLQRGISIPLSGQRVIVKIGYPLDTTLTTVTIGGNPATIPWTQPRLFIRGSLGHAAASGNPGISGVSRRTVRYGTIAGQGTLSAILPIPPWATAVAFENPALANPTLEFRQFANGVAGAQILSSALVGKGDVDTVPIAAGARFAGFFNGAAGAFANVKAIYYLGG